MPAWQAYSFLESGQDSQPWSDTKPFGRASSSGRGLPESWKERESPALQAACAILLQQGAEGYWGDPWQKGTQTVNELMDSRSWRRCISQASISSGQTEAHLMQHSKCLSSLVTQTCAAEGVGWAHVSCRARESSPAGRQGVLRPSEARPAATQDGGMQQTVSPAESARKGGTCCLHTRHELRAGKCVPCSHALGAGTPAGDQQTPLLSMHWAVRQSAPPIWAKQY